MTRQNCHRNLRTILHKAIDHCVNSQGRHRFPGRLIGPGLMTRRVVSSTNIKQVRVLEPPYTLIRNLKIIQ